MEVVRIKPRVLHVLRSVMLAGAGAVVWLALSSTAANADSGSTHDHKIPDGAGSAVTNVVSNSTAGLSGTLGKLVPAVVAAPAPVSNPAPVVQQVVQQDGQQQPAVRVPTLVVSELPPLTETVDRLVASTPVVNSIVPEGTVGAVTAPVVSPVVGAVTGVGKSVGTLTGGIVAPTLDAVGATLDALPATLPVMPQTVPSLQLPDTGAGDVPPVTQVAAAPMVNLAGFSGPSELGKPSWSGTVRSGGYVSPSAPLSPSDETFPDGAPGSGDPGTGSATLTGNTLGAAAAWLPGMNMFSPLAGALVSTAAAGKIPAPVSFDPGSSPD